MSKMQTLILIKGRQGPTMKNIMCRGLESNSADNPYIWPSPIHLFSQDFKTVRGGGGGIHTMKNAS